MESTKESTSFPKTCGKQADICAKLWITSKNAVDFNKTGLNEGKYKE